MHWPYLLVATLEPQAWLTPVLRLTSGLQQPLLLLLLYSSLALLLPLLLLLLC
jgi:hypothetical protein